MAKTLAQWFAGALLRWRLERRLHRLRAIPSRPLERTIPVTLPFLDGYKTYLIAAAMLLAGLSQLVGLDLPSFDDEAAGHLIMEAFAIIFLRRGIKTSS